MEKNPRSIVISYCLVRHDAPDFSIGKAMAQTNHCGTEMTELLQDKNFGDLNALYEEWKSDPEAEAALFEAKRQLNEAMENQTTGPTLDLLARILDEKRAIADSLKRKFGTVLTLAVTAAEMRQAVSLAQLLGLHAGIINDPTYPIRDGDRYTTASVDTCAFIFGRKDACKPIVGGFDLFGPQHVPNV